MRVPQASVNAVASRYIHALLVRQAAWNMDMLARMSVLEGAAGVSPGKWIAQRERGFASALEHFGPNLAASWTSATDRGLYDQAVGVANHALRNTAGMDGDELIQDLITYSSSSSGPKRQKVFYSIGESLKNHDRDLSDGKITPESPLVRGRLVNWVQNAARDVLTSKHEKSTVSLNATPPGYGGGSGSGSGRKEHATHALTHDERENLLLLALQSPGGSGSELRRIIDALIDRTFTATERPIVRLFLEKISHPKYRSPASMREMVTKFDVNKWFTQAYNLVRREIMETTGISPQRLTNILGSDAAKVFRFMTDVVGHDARVRSVLDELAEEIEMLEPGAGHRMASRNGRRAAMELIDAILAALPPEQTPHEQHSNVREFFEKDQFKDWDQQALPSSQFMRGPAELRVAQRWLRSRRAPTPT